MHSYEFHRVRVTHISPGNRGLTQRDVFTSNEHPSFRYQKLASSSLPGIFRSTRSNCLQPGLSAEDPKPPRHFTCTSALAPREAIWAALPVICPSGEGH